eukprot:6547463-Pyramimonas_sp.AAC.1
MPRPGGSAVKGAMGGAGAWWKRRGKRDGEHWSLFGEEGWDGGFGDPKQRLGGVGARWGSWRN